MTSNRSAEPAAGDALVLFGLTGDLGEKKLFPAIVELATTGRLTGPFIGVGRSDHSDDDLWDMLIEATGDDGVALRGTLDLSYLQGDSEEPDTYDRLAERLGGAETPVIYVAVPPDLFPGIAGNIADSPISDDARLVVEKPFGHDAASARELYDDIDAAIGADRLFAVDHFLAKSSVENLVAFRAANPSIDAAMRSGPVKRIEVTMAEGFGVDGRGGFYDDVGATRDVVQNHLLQLIAVLLMEPPEDDSADAFDEARSELLESMEPIDPGACVAGQFDGFRDLDDVDDDSKTETFFAASLSVDNDRWSGTEIVLRTGKELSESYTEAIVVFSDDELAPNRIRYQLKPDATILIELSVLDPADHGPAPLTVRIDAPQGHGELSDYATMLAGALEGDQRHFARIEGIEAAWRVVEPILSRNEEPLPYRPGSMGPDRADELVSTGSWLPHRSPPSRAGTPTEGPTDETGDRS